MDTAFDLEADDDDLCDIGAALAADPDEDLSWQEQALCAQTDPEAFYPERGGSTREAKAICLRCNVRAECLEYALKYRVRFGIWGGLSDQERRNLTYGDVVQLSEPPAVNISADGRALLTTREVYDALGLPRQTGIRDVQLRGFAPDAERGPHNSYRWDEKTIENAPHCPGCGIKFRPINGTEYCSARCRMRRTMLTTTQAARVAGIRGDAVRGLRSLGLTPVETATGFLWDPDAVQAAKAA